jgi:hypothetical protein
MKFELTPDNRNQPDSALLEDLRAVAKSLGKDFVARDEYQKLGRFSPKTTSTR